MRYGETTVVNSLILEAPTFAQDITFTAPTKGYQFTLETLRNATATTKGLFGSRGIIAGGQNYLMTTDFVSAATTTFAPRWLFEGDVRWASSGNGNFAYITGDGKLYTWGQTTVGLGRGASPTTPQYPTQVGTDTDWRSVHCGAGYMLGTKTDGTLWGWGQSTSGRAGIGTGTATAPTKIGTKTDWTTIVACNDSASFMVDASNNLYSCGATNYNGSTSTTTTPTLLSTFNSAGYGTITRIHSNYQTTGVIAGGKLFTCGNNVNYLTGQGIATSATAALTQVGSQTDWVDVNIGVYSAAGVRSGTTGFWGWGTNSNRALGPSSGTTALTAPTLIDPLGVTARQVCNMGGGTGICGTVVIYDDADGAKIYLNGTGNVFGISNTATVERQIMKLPVGTYSYFSNTDGLIIVVQ